MNFKIMFISIIIFISFLSSKSINHERYDGQNILKNKTAQTRNEEDEIITIDFEGNLDGWNQDDGWELTTQSFSSPTHSYNSPDINDTGEYSFHNLYSEEIELPSLFDEEIIQYSFSLNCNMPNNSQNDNPDYLADYFMVSARDVNESAWHISNFTPIDGNNWWCADEGLGGYLDGWIQYLDTPSFTVAEGGSLSVDMRWGIEDPADSETEFPSTCASTGWDQANVQISTDAGNTWTIINGTTPYDFECGYGTLYNGFETAPGWAGIQDWHNVSFDLSGYADETVNIRFAFYSDPSYSIIDDDELIGLQIDNILVLGALNDTGENSEMNASGENWIEQFYDYCDEDRPGYLDWEIYSPGDPYNGNIDMSLASLEDKTIQFRFQTRYDGNNSTQGEGLYIDDLYLYRKSTFNPISPGGLNGYLINDDLYLGWDDLNISGFGTFITDNDTILEVIELDNTSLGDAWVGVEIYNAGTTIIDSVDIYIMDGRFDGMLGGFQSIGTDYNSQPEYIKTVDFSFIDDNNNILPINSWLRVHLDSPWTFYGSFIIGQTLGENPSSNVASDNASYNYDSPAPIDNSGESQYSRINIGGWQDWSSIISEEPDLNDGEWAIRPFINYSSPNATYNLFKNDELIISGLQSFEYLDENIENGNTYKYNVSATYPNGMTSPMSEDYSITITDCEINEPGCGCDSCDSNICIIDCSLNCIDLFVLEEEEVTIFSYYRNDNNCDDGELNEINLDCIELGDGTDCIIDLSIDEELEIPQNFALGQNFPNPFNPYTVIPFAVPKISNVDLTIYNIIGQEVHRKSFKNIYPGNYEYSWSATDFQSGIYIYMMETNSGISLKQKMLLIK